MTGVQTCALPIFAQFKVWEDDLKKFKLKTHTPSAGERILVDNLSFDVLWPSRGKLAEFQALAPKDLNESSIVLRMNTSLGFCGYFTGDIPIEIFNSVVDRRCGLLKVGHHGSKTGTNAQIIEKVAPEVALIEVGKNNRYGHPNKEVIDLLILKGTHIYRTDTDGSVQIVIEGGKWKAFKRS